MNFVDAHCHLDLCQQKEIPAIIERAKKANVQIITNGVNPESNRKVLELAEKYSEVKSALGLYPIDALKLSDKEITQELNFIRSNKDKIVAIGEVGMDFKESDEIERQQQTFQKIIELAKEIDKPLIIHSRKAEKEVIEILEKNKAEKVIMHCFSGKFSLVEKIVKNNWKLTIPTNVKHSEHFQNIIKKIPIGNLLCETDSPFLHPDKLRDNEPANVVESYKKIAEIKNIPLNEVQKIVRHSITLLMPKFK